MIKVRHYNSSDEFKEAIRDAAGLKDKISSMFRSGATQEDFERAGIKFVPVHD